VGIPSTAFFALFEGQTVLRSTLFSLSREGVRILRRATRYCRAAAEVFRSEEGQWPTVSDELQPDDLEEGSRVRVEWSPRGGRGASDDATGEVTQVWRPDDTVEEFTVERDDDAINVYTDYRKPVVERVEGGLEDGVEPETETVGRLDRIVPASD